MFSILVKPEKSGFFVIFLGLTTKGKEELKNALLKQEKELERKNLELSVKNTQWNLKTKWIVLIGIVIGILGWILALLQFIFNK